VRSASIAYIHMLLLLPIIREAPRWLILRGRDGDLSARQPRSVGHKSVEQKAGENVIRSMSGKIQDAAERRR
jgi:hypothetical protein